MKVNHEAQALLCDREAEGEEMCRRSMISGGVDHSGRLLTTGMRKT